MDAHAAGVKDRSLAGVHIYPGDGSYEKSTELSRAAQMGVSTCGNSCLNGWKNRAFEC